MKFLKLLSRYIKDVVYGANDGIVTTFAVVSSVEGAKFGTAVILAVGFASLFADGFSMAASDYLANKAQAAKNKNKNKHKENSRQDFPNPKMSAFFTFLAFLLIGAIPLTPYFFYSILAKNTYLLSGIATAIALFGVGALRTKATGGNSLKAGIEMLLIGGSAAAVAFFIGRFIEQWQ